MRAGALKVINCHAAGAVGWVADEGNGSVGGVGEMDVELGGPVV